METSKVIIALAALAQETRLAVYRLLVEHAPDGMPAGQVAERLKIPAPSLSFHLKELTHSGLVTQERAGRNLIYRAAFDRMNAVLGYLTENCCQGAGCAVEPRAESCC